MDAYTQGVLFIFGSIAAFILIFNGLFYGAMYTRINKRRLQKILELGELSPDKTVYDLGCGFGRIMFAAAESGAYVVGYEIDPAKVFWIRQAIKNKLMLGDANMLKVNVENTNLLNANLSEADVVYCYLAPKLMQKLGEKAKTEMQHGTKLITVEHKIDALNPSYADPAEKIWMYTL